MSKENDRVNHPEHYTSHPSGVECIDITKHFDFCIGNVIKYCWRSGIKKEEGMSDKEKEIEDLEKARFYLNEKISMLKNETPDPLNKAFPISYVSRADLRHLGFNISNVTDSDMERIASKMSDSFCDNLYWEALESIASDYINIPKLKL